MSESPVIVVLAAGRSSRFTGAGHKLAQSLGSGTVLGQTVRHAIETGLPVVVVTTETLMPEVSGLVAERDVVVLPSWQRPPDGAGMGYSIAAGVAARPGAAGWLMLPGDMPWVRPASIRAVADELLHHPVVIAQHQGRRGHPVGFSPELYSDLVGLSGDEGARRIVARYPAHGLELGDPGVLVDIDTQADLAAARSVAADGAALQPR